WTNCPGEELRCRCLNSCSRRSDFAHQGRVAPSSSPPFFASSAESAVDMISPVRLVECPRDAWQGLQQQIPTATKVAYLCALVAAGFKHIDAVSFVSRKAVPPMGDSVEVLKQL